MMTPSGTAERVHPTADTAGEHGKSVITEFLNATRSAAGSLLQQQKRQIAERMSGVAEALRCAVQPLDRSQNRILSRYVEQAADRVQEISHNLRNRHWNELVADSEEFARRQPTLFVL